MCSLFFLILHFHFISIRELRNASLFQNSTSQIPTINNQTEELSLETNCRVLYFSPCTVVELVMKKLGDPESFDLEGKLGNFLFGGKVYESGTIKNKKPDEAHFKSNPLQNSLVAPIIYKFLE